MKSRQSHKPLGKKSKGKLRFAKGYRTTTVGHTSRQAKQFASGIMGKYGWDRNNYLGMFALIFKGKGLLTDKELATIQNPSDRAWILQLQVQLQSLKHPESAPLITKQQTIEHIQKLVAQSGYRLPKQVLVEEKQQEMKRLSSELAPAVAELPIKKKRGRKSNKSKALESQLLTREENVHVAKDGDVKSVQAGINVVNKRNSPIIQRSMRQLVASIGMLAHSTSSKTNQPSPMVNGVQHTGPTTNIQRKTLQLLYKQASSDGAQISARAIKGDEKKAEKSNHSNVANHVDAIRNTSNWLEQFQSGKLILGHSEDKFNGALGSEQASLPASASLLGMAKAILQEVTQTPIQHRGTSSSGSPIRRKAEVLETGFTEEISPIETRKSLKLGEGPFSGKSSPSAVRFIRSLLLKHVEEQEAQASKQAYLEQAETEDATRKSSNRSSLALAKGFLSSSGQPLAINAASLTSRLPRSMHASTRTASPSRSGMREFDSSTTRVWRKITGQEEALQQQAFSSERQEQGSGTMEVVQRLHQLQEQHQTSQLNEQIELLAARQGLAQQQEQLEQRVTQIQQENQMQQEQQIQQEQRIQQENQIEQERQQLQPKSSLYEQSEQQETPSKDSVGSPQGNEVYQAQLDQQEMNEDVGFTEFVRLQPVEQPVKQKRGRPRKNSGGIPTTQEAASTSFNVTNESIASLPDIRLQTEDAVPVPGTYQEPEEDTAASKRVKSATAYPSQVYTEPVRMEKRRASQKIQSNESWLQQLITIQRQPSSDDFFIRSTNSVSKGTDIRTKSAGKLIQQSFRESLMAPKILSQSAKRNEQLLGSQPLHRQNRQKENQVSRGSHLQQEQKQLEEAAPSVVQMRPMAQADDTLHSEVTFRRQADNDRLQTIKPDNQQFPNQSQVGKNNRPAGELAKEIAARVADASIRSIGILVPMSVKQGESKTNTSREVVRLLRSAHRQSEAGTSQLTGQAQPGSTETNFPSVAQGTTVQQTLAAEIASKAARNSITYVTSSNKSKVREGTGQLQRRLLGPTSSVEDGIKNVSTEMSSANRLSGRVVASSQTQSLVNESVNESSLHETTSARTNGKSTRLSPLDMVRRAGSQSRVNRVREQQATIQRKIDLGQFTSQKSPIGTQSSSVLSGEKSTSVTRSSPTWERSLLTLRAGRVEDGTVTRRISAVDQQQHAPTLQTSSVSELSAQEIRSTDKEQDSQSRNLQSGQAQESLTNDPIQQNSLSNQIQGNKENVEAEQHRSDLANSLQADRVDGDRNAQFNPPSRELVRGQRVQRTSDFGNRSRQSEDNRIGHSLQLRRMRRIEQGSLVQRSLGIENGGIQARRANLVTADTLDQRKQSGDILRRSSVEQSSGNLIARKAISGSVNESAGVSTTSSAQAGRTVIQAQGQLPSQKATMQSANNLIQRVSETRIRQLMNRATQGDSRQGSNPRSEVSETSRNGTVTWSKAQAEHVQRRVIVEDREREPKREERGSESHLEADRFQVESAEQTIRAMISAQVEERAQALEPAAASPAAEVVTGTRVARAPRARQSASMTQRVMPVLASSAGALRAAPAGMAAASPAAAAQRLPSRGMGSLIQAAASGRAAAPTAGVQRAASLTNSSSQGMPAMSMLMQARTPQPPIGASQASPPVRSVPMQSRIQPTGLSVPAAGQEQLASPISMLEHKQAITSQLADTPLEMDWLRTKAVADQESMPAAPVEQTPPELSEEQLQELVKQLPQLDIAKIAEKVYREIEKKMKFERQRRGV
ncbi:hypothetical protein [Paenibacillus qinlingensis]|uniref:Uncharacterized protein n=1 Tax=Paenibacillus qinlingensis TaxID=1837343 RepID=A0ABU1P0V2_9BACL|nr:hypothetical protein [Paenibacillus qinlingensis]MDR6553375.1 hypothetical protein [Paenibacillus qinlingensis]